VFDGANPARPAPESTPRSTPLRLAIVSTYDELCGIAGYARALEQQLRPHAAVTVFDLDQYLLRNPRARMQRQADRHIEDIAKQLKYFDSVNIQLEYGTLGRSQAQILRRLRKLVVAAPAVTITFHTILGHETLNWGEIGQLLIKGRLARISQIIGSYRWRQSVGSRTYALLRARQRQQSLQCIVHTRRDARLLHDIYRINNVSHHPLSFISAHQAEQVRQAATREQFPLLRTLPLEAKLIGTFGFLSPYKGFETVLRALRYLPEDHHLLIFGGVHPQTIRQNQTLDPYVRNLLFEARIGQTIFDTAEAKGPGLTITLESGAKDLFGRHPDDLQHRVHFLGVHNDEAFMRAMALCDAVVMPYLEVGQSSSGPIAMALEMGCRVLASRTVAFMQFARYHPGQVEFFDIGNYAELADLIRTGTPAPLGQRRLAYNTETNVDLYLQANGAPPPQKRPQAPAELPETVA
jgi:glycosyltransferase involved in cell wall biosynthesis